jgi:hypothetical protein
MESAKKTITGDAEGNKPRRTGRIMADPVVSCRLEDGGALLFNPDTDTTLLINSSGLLVWNFLQKPRTIEDIAVYLMTHFSGFRDTPAVIQDAEAFVQDLTPDFITEDGADARKPAAS